MLRYKFYLLIIFLYILHFLFAVTISAQSDYTHKTDSLREELKQNSGSKKVNTQLELALNIIMSDTDEALKLANSALESALESDNKEFEMRAYYVLGRIYFVKKDYRLSNTYYNRAVQVSNVLNENWYKGEIFFRQGVIYHQNGEPFLALEKFNNSIQACLASDNYRIIGSSYSMMGTIFRLNGIYDRAIEYIIKSKLNYEKANFSEGDAWATYLLGRIYVDLKNHEKALEYFEEALEKYQRLAVIDGRKEGIAICFEQIALINMEAGNLDEARRNVNEVYKIHTESGSEYGLSNAYKIFGRIEYYSGKLREAEKYLDDALILKKEVNDLLSLPRIYLYKGLVFIKQGKFDEGIANINQGLEISVSNEQKKIQLEIYTKLTEVYLKNNDYEKVIFNQNKQIEIQNQILSGSANIKIEQLQAFYELDQKNSLIAELKNQNEINNLMLKQQRTYQIMMLIGILFVLVIALIISLFYNKLRIKNKELNALNITKDRLFSIIAHDLKGPIGSSLELSKILIEDSENKKQPQINNYSSLIYQSLNSSYSLLNNLLEWARNQFQKIEFHPQSLNLSILLQDVLKHLSFLSQNKNISLITNCEDSMQIFADEGMLKTIVRNLLSNAIKFSSPNGEIIISANENDKFVQLSVQDFGTGIEPELIPRLFDNSTNTTSFGTLGEKGTGLGLILVKDFIEKHGGKIWVESEVDSGSTFTFQLPKK